MAAVPPPPFWSSIQDRQGIIPPVWQAFLTQAQRTLAVDVAPADGPYLTTTADADLTGAANLGALTTGLVKVTVAAGVAVPSTVAIVPVANGGTGLATGTSGGILGFTAAGTLTSSAVLTANRLMLGGGAGAVPAVLGSLGTTTTILHGNAGGAPTFSAVSLTADVSGILPLANGGTGANLNATGGAKQYVKQATAGGTFTVGTIPASDVASGAALSKVDDTNVTLTLGGTPTAALLVASSLTLGWTGTLAVARGGTGTGTAFTAGSVVFAGAAGVYTQDNANLFWDDTNNRLGIGTATPGQPLEVAGVIRARTLVQFHDGTATAYGDVGKSGAWEGNADTNIAVAAEAGNEVRLYANGSGTATVRVVATATLLNGVLNLKNYTVATLPAGTRGDIAYVTDALAPAFLTAIVGGGAAVAPVFFNGTNWVGF